uniref:SAM domain-containing protein n=1 Tax=Ascaris lumbricoides TaxID=6252 RepID=A0A0M3IGC2_ASCLU
LFYFQEKESSQRELSPSSPLITRLNGSSSNNDSKEFIFPNLIRCDDLIPPQMFFKLGGPFGLKVRNDFKNLGLLTVGDVARLNEEEVRVLPVKEPQVNTVRSVLLEYATQIAKDASITPRHMATMHHEEDTDMRILDSAEEEKENEEKVFKLSEETLKLAQPVVFAEEVGDNSEGSGHTNARAGELLEDCNRTQFTEAESEAAVKSEDVKRNLDAANADVIIEKCGVEGTAARKEQILHGANESTTNLATQPPQIEESSRKPARFDVNLPCAGGDEEICVSVDSCVSGESASGQCAVTDKAKEMRFSQCTDIAHQKLEHSDGCTSGLGNMNKEVVARQSLRSSSHGESAVLEEGDSFSPSASGALINDIEPESNVALKDVAQTRYIESVPSNDQAVVKTYAKKVAADGNFGIRVIGETGEDLPLSLQHNILHDAFEVIEHMPALVGEDSETPSTEDLLKMHGKLASANALLCCQMNMLNRLLLNSMKQSVVRRPNSSLLLSLICFFPICLNTSFYLFTELFRDGET